MRKTIVLLVTVLFFSVGCTDFDDKLNVQIRVENGTDLTLNKVLIDNLEYNDIDAGSKTAYQAKEDFLSVQLISVEADSILRSISIDNIQQDTLLPGRYTYKINTLTEAEGLLYEVIED